MSAASEGERWAPRCGDTHVHGGNKRAAAHDAVDLRIEPQSRVAARDPDGLGIAQDDLDPPTQISLAAEEAARPLPRLVVPPRVLHCQRAAAADAAAATAPTPAAAAAATTSASTTAATATAAAASTTHRPARRRNRAADGDDAARAEAVAQHCGPMQRRRLVALRARRKV